MDQFSSTSKCRHSTYLIKESKGWNTKFFANQYPIHSPPSTRPIPDHYSTIHKWTPSGTSRVKFDWSSLLGEFGWSGRSSLSDQQWELSLRYLRYINQSARHSLGCFIHRWSAPVHQNILIRIFWCTCALHRWIKQRTHCIATHWYLMSGYSPSVAHSVASCSAQCSRPAKSSGVLELE